MSQLEYCLWNAKNYRQKLRVKELGKEPPSNSRRSRRRDSRGAPPTSRGRQSTSYPVGVLEKFRQKDKSKGKKKQKTIGLLNGPWSLNSFKYVLVTSIVKIGYFVCCVFRCKVKRHFSSLFGPGQPLIRPREAQRLPKWCLKNCKTSRLGPAAG